MFFFFLPFSPPHIKSFLTASLSVLNVVHIEREREIFQCMPSFSKRQFSAQFPIEKVFEVSAACSEFLIYAPYLSFFSSE
jgi:hypothetical protein